MTRMQEIRAAKALEWQLCKNDPSRAMDTLEALRDAESDEFNRTAYGIQSTTTAQPRGCGRSW